MQKLKNQNGFSVLDGILVVIALAAIGAAGYFAYTGHHQKAVTVAKTVSKPTTLPAQATSPTADWKTYTSAAEPALSFKYPPSWTASQTNSAGGVVGTDPGGDGLDLASPNGSVITYTSDAEGFGGACPPGAPHVMITAVQSLPNASGLYYVETQVAGDTNVGVIDIAANNNTAPTAGEDTGSCQFYTVFDSRSVASHQLLLGTLDKPIKSADLATAKLILESLKY